MLLGSAVNLSVCRGVGSKMGRFLMSVDKKIRLGAGADFLSVGESEPEPSF